MPTAKFDLTHYSLSKNEIENYANMDIYSGELKEITGEDVSLKDLDFYLSRF